MKFTVNCNHLVHEGGSDDFIRFACAADTLGYDHFRILDHVLGVVAEKHPKMPPTPYTHESRFPEIFTLMAYLSAVTERIGFISGVLGLPARQTALVAKQAAEVDKLSGGRLILGVGIGYLPIEFAAMGAGFKDRAPRIEEQLQLLRALWTEEAVEFKGTWHDFQHVNINPLPVQRPIPIWMGAGRTTQPVPPEKVLRRIGKYADGFMPLFQINPDTGKLEEDAIVALELVRQTARETGRDSAQMKLEITLSPVDKSHTQVKDEIAYLESIGVTHVHVRFPNGPLGDQLAFIEEFAVVRDAYRNETRRL
ncbi:MAG: LLM class F420-dependent oxidoreductase [Porticoccaceae bacterium]|mgnify:CR=1 FL=1|jgi:probable F420-dependent oxidoreductase|nr:LLM class F420-dependent oxidoreductase [Porticoccaceae bacterium]